MTINTNLGRVQYFGNNVTVAFAYNNRVLDKTHLLVKRTVIATGVTTDLILDSGGADGFSVVLGPTSATVTTVSAPATGTTLTIIPNVPLTQTADYTENDPFPAETHENALDKLTLIEQQQNDSINRAIKFSDTSATTVDGTILENPVDGRALIWSGVTGDVINGPNAADIADAQANAAIAAQAAIDAAASAAAAAASAAGMSWRPPVRAATTTTLPACTYANGVSGVGATLTGNVNGALAAQDGVTLALNDDLLVQNQAAQLQNGVYRVTQVGTAGTPFILTRRTDADSWAELISQTVTVSEGSTQAEGLYVCTINAGGTIGVTAVTWVGINLQTPIADGSLTYAKLAAAALASTADILAGTPSKLVTAAAMNAALGPVLLQTFTISNQATLNVTSVFSATYDEYLVELSAMLPITDDVSLRMRTSSNNGSSWDSGGSDYQSMYTRSIAGSTTIVNENTYTAGSDITMSATTATNGWGNAAGENFQGTIRFKNVNGASNYKLIEYNFVGLAAGAFLINSKGQAARNSAAIINAFQLYFSSGNLSLGFVKVYGVKK